MPGCFVGSIICHGRNASTISNEFEKIGRFTLLVQVEKWINVLWTFIVEKPVLFVLAMGLIIAVTSVVSEIIIYWLARIGGRALVERFSRWLRVDMRHFDRAESMFVRWGVGLVMFGRILPGVRTLVSVPAGMTRMNFGLFFGASLGGAYLWNTLLVAAGYLLGFNVTLFGVSIL